MTSWFRPLLTQIFKRMFLGIKAVDELWDDGPLGPDMSPSSHRSKRLKLKETQKDYKCHSCIICSCYVSVSCCFACVWSFVTYLRYLLIVCVSLQSLCVSLSLSLQLFCIVMVFLLCCSFVCVFFVVILCLFQVFLWSCFVTLCIILCHFGSLSSPSFLTLKLLCDSLHHFVSVCVSFESSFEVVLWVFAIVLHYRGLCFAVVLCLSVVILCLFQVIWSLFEVVSWLFDIVLPCVVSLYIIVSFCVVALLLWGLCSSLVLFMSLCTFYKSLFLSLKWLCGSLQSFCILLCLFWGFFFFLCCCFVF